VLSPPRPSRSDIALLVVVVLVLLHHIDHVLREDLSGWPFTQDATLFTASLLIYPILLGEFLLLRRSPWVMFALTAALLGFVQVTHMFFETPADQFTTWAEGMSPVPDTLGQPNLLGVSSPTLGVVSVAVSMLLSAALAVKLVVLAGEVRTLHWVARGLASTMLVLVLGSAALYGWAVVSTDSSKFARMIVWQAEDVLDYQRFPARSISAHSPTFHFRRGPDANRLPVETVRVREDGQVVERDLEEFLVSTRTAAFLVIKNNTLLSESYFNGYQHDSTVASFSVAKPFVSALVGIAIAEGYIGSVDDAVTEYIPELADRDPRFKRITLHHLLTMSSGLAEKDPYYDTDFRAVALNDTAVVRPPGEEFQYNNVDPVFLGLVIERVTGLSVSAYLEEKLWGRLGMEADGSWNLDSEESGFEMMQTGLNGRAVDFAKFGALYLNKGSWHGKQLVPRAWVKASTGVDAETDPSPEFQYYWWTRPGSESPNDYWTQGNHGQFIYVAPARDIVLVRFGIEYGYEYWPEFFAELARRL
jgi:CubicO group peptidase (beta-lactamase class C family)